MGHSCDDKGSAALRAAAARQPGRDHRRRFVSGLGRVELHQRVHPADRRRDTLAVHGSMMLKLGFGWSTTAIIDGKAFASPGISSPGDVASPVAKSSRRILLASLIVECAVDSSAATFRYTSTPLRTVSR